ncbi:hypothetical protein, partial [Pseudomonas kitaguniensis]|uniref:hypothetical protein n=1 Tax=Pseudomonas kitaguniensis TaxID=2607908 RepID=UPI003CFE08CE
LQRVTFEKPEAGPVKSNQNALAPPLGASLWFGVPSLRNICVRPAWFNGPPLDQNQKQAA